MGYRVVILEDDCNFSIKMKEGLEDWGHIVIGVYESAKLFFDDLSKLNPSLILLKIDLKGTLNGIKTAQLLHKMNIPVIFTTSNKENTFFEIARKTKGIAYLIRPFNMLTLRSIIEFSPLLTLQEKERIHSNCLFLKRRGEFKKILIPNISWIKSDKNYCSIYVNNQVFVEKISLKKLLSNLNSPLLLKIHKSHAVNINFITNYSRNKNTVYNPCREKL